MHETILVVDDDREIVGAIAILLEKEGYRVIRAYNGMEALDRVMDPAVQLLLIDVMMPRLDGLSAVMRIRDRRNLPIIVLSAKAGLEDRVNVLRLGADDFIPKPFDNAEVLARVEAQLRRYKQFSAPAGSGQGLLTHADLVLDRESVRVTAAGKEVPLTAREFDILALLMSHPKKVYTREQLYENVWGGEYFGDDNTVNVHISNLRSKLAKASDREYIKTVWGIGFKMNDQQETL